MCSNSLNSFGLSLWILWAPWDQDSGTRSKGWTGQTDGHGRTDGQADGRTDRTDGSDGSVGWIFAIKAEMADLFTIYLDGT
jgi:hypothetical protein